MTIDYGEVRLRTSAIYKQPKEIFSPPSTTTTTNTFLDWNPLAATYFDWKKMEDLRLGLSLGNSASFANHRRHWADLAASSMSIADTIKSSLKKGIDVNRAPTTERDMEEDDDEEEEEAWISSPKSTVSSASAGKRGLIEESENDRTCSGGGPTTTTSEDEDCGDGPRKKLRLSKDQSAILEESFKEHNTLNPKQKLSLAKQLNLRPRQVEVWFQNRRARTKLKQTEVDYEFLKRCCENLTEENRRLQKEVQELRALKMSPQFYMQMAPPTTLTLCPSCERVAVSSSTSSSTTTFAASSKPPQPGTPHHSPWSGSGNGSSKINRQFSQQQQQQSHPFFQNRPLMPVGGMPVLPWAPMPTCQRL